MTLRLMASGAVAGDCKKILARVDCGPFYSGCTYNDMEALWCSDSPVRGNLNDTWHLCASPDFNCSENTVPDDELGIDGREISSCWNLKTANSGR